jgi:hypothetical protein
MAQGLALVVVCDEQALARDGEDQSLVDEDRHRTPGRARG